MDIKVKPQSPVLACIISTAASLAVVGLSWIVLGPPPPWALFIFAATMGVLIPYWQFRDRARGCAEGLVAAEQIATYCKREANVTAAIVDLGEGTIAYVIREEGDDEGA